MFVRLNHLGAAVTALTLMCATPAVAAADAPFGSRDSIEQLQPGSFQWQPERAQEGPLEIVISLREQRAYVYRAGELIGVSTISSGMEGRESPIGRFHILEKKRTHRSNRYDDAPMPFMMRLNWYGVAMHAGKVPGYPASHGCIRLPAKFAEKLFAAADLGAFVFVTEDVPDSPENALMLARANADAPIPVDRLPRGTGATFHAE